ncbi:hypothetical protein YC2023_115530 [Brassica napus]
MEKDEEKILFDCLNIRTRSEITESELKILEPDPKFKNTRTDSTLLYQNTQKSEISDPNPNGYPTGTRSPIPIVSSSHRRRLSELKDEVAAMAVTLFPLSLIYSLLIGDCSTPLSIQSASSLQKVTSAINTFSFTHDYHNFEKNQKITLFNFRCSNVAEVRLLRFWEARNLRK